MRRFLSTVALLAASATLAGACGKANESQPGVGTKGDESEAGRQLGFPVFATKNTTRVGGADAVADAAAVAQAVYPGKGTLSRPSAVSLVDVRDWQAAVAASVFMSRPLRAPVLYTDDGGVPGATQGALEALSPTGSRPAGGAQVIRVGRAAEPDDVKSSDIEGNNPYAIARSIDTFQTAARGGKPSKTVVIASGERAEYAMPAAAWAAKSGDPVLFVSSRAVPPETRRALMAHSQPRIYVLGPKSVIPDAVVRNLQRLGTVVRIAGADPVRNAVAFARYVDGAFGWGVVDPGHGLVFASDRRPLDAAAAAPLSSSGSYGPLLLVQGPTMPLALQQYLLDIQPGFDKDPVRGVYNRGWLIGDAEAIPEEVQARIDSLLEIVPVQKEQTPKSQGQDDREPGAAPAPDGGAPQRGPKSQPAPRGGGPGRSGGTD